MRHQYRYSRQQVPKNTLNNIFPFLNVIKEMNNPKPQPIDYEN